MVSDAVSALSYDSRCLHLVYLNPNNTAGIYLLLVLF